MKKVFLASIILSSLVAIGLIGCGDGGDTGLSNRVGVHGERIAIISPAPGTKFVVGEKIELVIRTENVTLAALPNDAARRKAESYWRSRSEPHAEVTAESQSKAFVINTNVSSMMAQAALNQTQSELSSRIQEVSETVQERPASEDGASKTYSQEVTEMFSPQSPGQAHITIGLHDQEGNFLGAESSVNFEVVSSEPAS